MSGFGETNNFSRGPRTDMRDGKSKSHSARICVDAQTAFEDLRIINAMTKRVTIL